MPFSCMYNFSESLNFEISGPYFRLKTFNIQFEDLHQRQSQWTVPDSELRESLRLAVAEVLLPAYRSFIKRFGFVFFCSSFHTLIGSVWFSEGWQKRTPREVLPFVW